jgi:iron complex transport system ATP-binding protein
MTSKPSTSFLQLNGVSPSLGAFCRVPQATKPFNLRVSPCERLAILGPSGAGKTTLLRLLSLDLSPVTGEVIFKGRKGPRWSVAELSHHRAVMSQSCQVAFGLEVKLVIGLARVARLSDPFGSEIVLQAAKLARADHLLARRCDTLSGGEYARVHLARVFAQLWDVREGLILVDEPLAALDLALQEHILQALDTFATERQHAIVAVLHDVNHALRVFDRLLLVKEGQLFADVASNRQAVPVLEALYGLALECFGTVDNAFFVAPFPKRSAVSCLR